VLEGKAQHAAKDLRVRLVGGFQDRLAQPLLPLAGQEQPLENSQPASREAIISPRVTWRPIAPISCSPCAEATKVSKTASPCAPPASMAAANRKPSVPAALQVR
jgi:hypothetical protein